jgi:hypothetical protein
VKAVLHRIQTSESTQAGAVEVSSRWEDVAVGGGGKATPDRQLKTTHARPTRVLKLIVNIDEECQIRLRLESQSPGLKQPQSHLFDFCVGSLGISSVPSERVLLAYR